MIRAVLDTNVIVSGFAVRVPTPGIPARILDHWRSSAFELVVSQHILEEVARTFRKPYFRRRLSSEQVTRILAALARPPGVVELSVAVQGIATHPEDDLILATAISGRAEYLVSGDRRLQAVGSYRGVTMLSPRRFLDLLEQGDVER